MIIFKKHNKIYDFYRYVKKKRYKPKLQSLEHSLGVSSQSGESNIECGANFVYFREVCGDGLGLDTETFVCCDRYTVFPLHGDYGTPVVRKDRLKTEMTKIRRLLKLFF